MPLILVVDDDVQARKWMQTVLEAEGYRVLEAGDGNEALAQYALHQPDLVVMDIYMPGKEGLETILQLSNHYLTVKVLAVSGNFYEGYDVGTLAKSFGAKGILPKPFSAKELLDQVETLLKTG
ncbi:MAG: response regulator [Nitrospirae bacterium]|nr:response regulator [Nitrospirota bacterium]